MTSSTFVHSCMVLTLAIVANSVQAAERLHDRSDIRSNATVYLAQGVDANLLEVPGNLLRASMDYDESYFTGFGYQHGLPAPVWLEAAFRWLHMEGMGTAVELVAVQHWGLQDNFETNIAYAIRSPRASLGPVTMRAGFSIGASYAFGDPSYEDGPESDPEKRYRFQNYNAYEVEWGVKRFPAFSLVTRLHHRSGAYGLIAPRRVGSNFVTAGVRWEW